MECHSKYVSFCLLKFTVSNAATSIQSAKPIVPQLTINQTESDQTGNDQTTDHGNKKAKKSIDSVYFINLKALSYLMT